MKSYLFEKKNKAGTWSKIGTVKNMSLSIKHLIPEPVTCQEKYIIKLDNLQVVMVVYYVVKR